VEYYCTPKLKLVDIARCGEGESMGIRAGRKKKQASVGPTVISRYAFNRKTSVPMVNK